MTITLQVRQRGTVTLPMRLREKYQIEDGDVFTLIDLGGAFLFAPGVSVVPRLVAQIEQIRKQEGLSVDDLIEGLDDEREQYDAARRRDG